MSNIFKLALTLAACTVAFNAAADSHVEAVWKCKLNDGKEMSDVHAANSAWVVHVNEATDVGEITSSTAETIVGSHSHFYFVDAYPSLAAWAAVQAYTDSDEGKAAMESIQSQFDDIFECGKNEVYKMTRN